MAKISKILFRGLIAVIRIAWALFSGMPLRFLEILGQVFPENSWGCKIRGVFYKPFLKRCGRNFQVALYAKLEHLSGIEVENDVYIGHGAWISGLRGGVLLEDEVMLGPFVSMISSNHTFYKGSARFGKSEGGRIEIGSGTWIASGVTVTAGITVGRSCLLSAGAVVTKNIAEGSIAGGVPAKIIGKTSQLGHAIDDKELEC